ncbi:MAG: hypothetical protein P1V97_26840 [Planctomycetota bacterium]|nr:hypothetical protein [Planctomycetota bacterium]
MGAIFSVVLLPFLTIVAAWASALGLRGRSRGAGILVSWAKLGARMLFWMAAIMLSRDHLLRVAGSHPESIGFFTLTISTVLALILALLMIYGERARKSAISLSKKSSRRDLMAGIGFGAMLGYFGLTTGFVPVLSLFPRSQAFSVFVMVLAWSYVSELWLRGILTPIFKKKIAEGPLLMGLAGLSLLSWLGLAAFGPFPFFVVLAPAAWLSAVTAFGYRWLGFAGSLGTHASFLFMILMPL